MTTDLTTLAGNLPSLKLDDDMRKSLANSFDDDDKTGGDGVDYVYFSGKSGDLTYGQDREDLDTEEEFLFLTPTITKGWVCWKEGDVAGRVKWSAFRPDAAVAEADLEDHKTTRPQDGWRPSSGFEFVGTDGKQYSFETSTKSGRGSVKKLIEEVLGRGPKDAPIAVFTFGKEKFLAQGEWNFKPKLSVLEWITEAEAADRLAAEDDVEEEEEVVEAPKKKRVRRA